MSDIPDKYKAAAIKAWSASCHLSFIRTENPWEPIARALMAAAREADEAATKRERERCAVRIETLEDMVFAASQFAGAVLDHAGLFDHPEGIRALDYFSSDGEAELLPWPNCDLPPAAILKGEA